MKKVLYSLSIIFFLGFAGFTQSLSADGCYLCSVNSADVCRDYCRFSGSDSFDTRKRCETKGCKITGTAACPTASNYKVCSVRLDSKFEYLFAGRSK
ncbi:hypothetical protein EHQ52_09080 [Leptospira koniambonensis]|uniref:Cys-rich protein n=1 Tax=Leptospira koniambonensis TaxID=2484950 RepID=A0A4R9J9W3_9LEPT|nr:hypothetical protein [Leptospira koniambonensis]TGL34641.1 hypothetical protein EHQ52_09080 [Leptospira koniambonensis]